ncbi:MAG: MBL fold metallo-hydrolase [Armatimonadetes bacterium]|nr:MBL fold metallo-hydrolase [Armatimonadota bacterium]
MPPYPANFVKFLGTAGSRFVVSKQLRASGGLWLRLAEQTVWIDPGPGALVRAYASRPKLDPESVDAVLVSHKHIDHANDVNVVIEAMTHGGHRRRGVLLAPGDALYEDSPICEYALSYIGQVQPLTETTVYRLGDLTVRVAARHDHPGETYGFLLEGGPATVGVLTDTRYFAALAQRYAAAEVLIINCVLEDNPDHRVYHLDRHDAERIIAAVRPRQAVLTHFGLRLLEAKPWEITEAMGQRLGLEVVAARDGMTLEIAGKAE